MTSGDNSDSISEFLIRLGKNLGVQYALLIVLFLRTIWGIWNSRDLTTGDTSSYYMTALEFSRSFTCSIAWSPLYTSYFGAFHWLNSDPYFVVTAHRVVLLLLLAILIFEISRRLLDQLAAWLVTAWWIVLPINHSSLYEVHLFALLPALIFWLLLAVDSSVWVRGGCVGLLALCTVLVRNEMLIALGLFGAISVSYDLWRLWCKRTDLSLLNYLAAYGVPMVIATSIILIFYWRSTTKFPELSASLEAKHTLNVAQIYSFGYGQRHPEYTDSPWTQYHNLMTRDFGKDLPSMREAVLANPKAMAEHFLWNILLIPSGLQVALFNCRSGEYNPDYAPTIQNQNVASSLSTLYIILIAMGILLFVLHRQYWWANWLAPRVWPVIGILCICVTVVIVMIMQRPRPSYMFPFTLALMWLGALSVQIILRHARFALVPMTLVAFTMPTYFLQPAKARERPLLTMMRFLQPYRNELSKSGAGVAAAGYPSELTSYLDLAKAQQNDLNAIIAAMPPDASLHETLRSKDVRFVIIAPYQMGESRVKSFMASAKSLGWKRHKSRQDVGKDYRFYIFPDGGEISQIAGRRSQKWYEDPLELQKLNGSPDIGPIFNGEALHRTKTLPIDGLFIGHGWYPFERFDGETFRWVNNDAEIVVTAPSGTQRQLSFELEPGPGFGGQPFDLQILDQHGELVAKIRVKGREQITLPFPVTPHRSAVFRLRVEGGSLPSQNDPRLLNFRVFKFGWSKP